MTEIHRRYDGGDGDTPEILLPGHGGDGRPIDIDPAEGAGRAQSAGSASPETRDFAAEPVSLRACIDPADEMRRGAPCIDPCRVGARSIGAGNSISGASYRRRKVTSTAYQDKPCKLPLVAGPS